jgi:hypothetical protein
VLGDVIVPDVEVPGIVELPNDPLEGSFVGLGNPVELGEGGVTVPPGIVELPVPLGP